MAGFISVGYFLTNLFFSVVLFLFWIRIFLRYFRISSLHPVSQAINTFTNPVIRPLEQLIYGKNAAPRRYDWVSLVLIIIIEFLKFACLSLVVYGAVMPASLLALFVAADLVVQPCNLMFYMILIRVIMSWINPAWQHPVAEVLAIVTRPLLILGRKIIPDISGFDFSPFIIMIILKVITLFLSASMPLPLL
ncbi:YggT family protein [Legionella spiritensis]|uniref:YggT family protein n=1 Tax=Legionella spiritensis TaxID=452 RepID=A0A0W0YXY4_LEGSP|nr:YggT family protein [Legionella spiritensis]KTD61519.1 YggT family protein [Legionella spiritensis]SNV32904.1 Integral membrane protein YggT, involved in response to extracytoplasmic stress (osmotic shock) [Legionella spiritensis]VEG92310.1 Integral membrane protein YggT, involved in response to extracytoplasmic stress (osmotic shock) [Legionella spiritensis]